MASWEDLAEDNLIAAGELSRNGRHRSAVSRAYFAVFSAVTHRLEQAKVDFPQDREGPSHIHLSKLVKDRIQGLDLRKRRALARIVSILYDGRLQADYHPRRTVGEKEASNAVYQAVRALRHLQIHDG